MIDAIGNVLKDLGGSWWALLVVVVPLVVWVLLFFQLLPSRRMWQYLGPKSLWPRGRAVRVLAAMNASTLDLYRSKVENIEAPTRPHSWDTVFTESDWRDLKHYRDPQGSIDDQLDVGLGEAILHRLARLGPGQTRHIWITGDAEVGKSAVLLHVFFAMLGVGDEAAGRRKAQGPVPMLLRPGHLPDAQVERLKPEQSFRPIFAAWLANRDVSLEAGTLDALSTEFEQALRDGKIAVFLDGYDKFLNLGLKEPMTTMLSFPLVVGTAAAAPVDRRANVSVAHLPPRSERYRASFGRLFAEHQDWLLAGNFAVLEDSYVKLIERAVTEAGESSDAVVLVDLMAGGASGRWYRMVKKLPRLKVLGVDRDETRIEMIERDPDLDRRYVAWQVALHGSTRGDASGQEAGNLLRDGGFDIRGMLPSVGRDAATGADVIVGKKALHEIRRDLQPVLISACQAALRDGGRLILFTDSMGCMGEHEQVRLTWFRKHLHASWSDKTPPDDLKQALMEAELDESEASVGLFCNLWVMLKDRANGNIPEVENRYFAGPAEISDWCAAVGLEPTAGGAFAGHYQIAPEKFNEEQLRDALDGLRDVEHPSHENIESIFQQTLRQRSPWFQLLINFGEAHLYPKGVQSKLGRRLSASQTQLLEVREAWQSAECTCSNLLATHELLQRISDSAGLWFDFPVHILEYTKRPADAATSSQRNASDRAD